MGCLFEFLFELIFESIIYTYAKLMCLVLPKHTFTPKGEKTLKCIVIWFAVAVGVALVIGAIMMTQEDDRIVNIGRYVTYISLAVIGIQIAMGIVVRIATRKR